MNLKAPVKKRFQGFKKKFLSSNKNLKEKRKKKINLKNNTLQQFNHTNLIKTLPNLKYQI